MEGKFHRRSVVAGAEVLLEPRHKLGGRVTTARALLLRDRKRNCLRLRLPDRKALRPRVQIEFLRKPNLPQRGRVMD
jgi:hypothetical protein